MNHQKLVLIALLALTSGLMGADSPTLPPVRKKPAVRPRTTAAYVVRPSSTTVKRREAVLSMSQNPDSEVAGNRLIAALDDQDSVSRALAVRELGRLKHRAALGRLTTILKTDAVTDVREAAAASLKQLDNPKAVPALSGALSDSSPAVRVTALMGLAHFRELGSRRAIEAACQDASADVRRTALFALGRLESPASTSAVEPLLKDPEASVRAVASQTLAELHVSTVTASLSGMLQDPSRAVQVSAARSLLKLGDASGFETAKVAVRDEDFAVRLLAIDALGWSRQPEAGTILSELAQNPPVNSLVAVKEALARHERLRKQK